MQELFERHHLKQADLTRALAKWHPPMSRTYAYYLWHGIKPPSLNAILAIRQAYCDIISDKELFAVLKQTRSSA